MTRSSQSRNEIDRIAAEWVARRDAGLSAAETARLAAWHGADPRHAEALARFESVWAAAARPRATGRAEALERRMGQLRRGTHRRFAAIAVAATLVIGAGGLWLQDLRPSRTPPAEASPTAVLLLPQQRILPDGSTIAFPDDSRFSVDVSGAPRRVKLLHGQAHFLVTANPARPFIVEAGGIEFRALGTAFLVRLEADSVQLVVTEGTVAVEQLGVSLLPPGPESSGPAPGVGPGHGVTLQLDATQPAATTVVAVPAAEVRQLLAWRNPRVEFSGAPLAVVVELLNRHNPVVLAIADPRLAQMQLSGVFRADDVDAFVHALELGFGVTAERSEGTIVLRSKP